MKVLWIVELEVFQKTKIGSINLLDFRLTNSILSYISVIAYHFSFIIEDLPRIKEKTKIFSHKTFKFIREEFILIYELIQPTHNRTVSTIQKLICTFIIKLRIFPV